MENEYKFSRRARADIFKYILILFLSFHAFQFIESLNSSKANFSKKSKVTSILPNSIKKKLDNYASKLSGGRHYIAILTGLSLLIIFLQAKTTTIRIDRRGIVSRNGFFSLTRIDDKVDMVSISDQQLRQTIFDRLLGLGRVVVYSKSDVTHSELVIKGISHRDAQIIFNFIDQRGIKNITELQISREIERDKGK